MSIDVDLIPGVGYFATGDGRTFVYDNSHELLLNLEGNYTDEDMRIFLAREFPAGLTKASADAWLEAPHAP